MSLTHCQKLPILLLAFLCFFCVSCSQDKSNVLSGYIEGEYTYVASGIAGTLFQLNVKRGQPVKKDTLLFSLDPEPDKSAMQAAQSTMEQLQAEVALAKIQTKRYAELYTHHATDQDTLDQKQTDYESKTKQLQAAEHSLSQTKWAYLQKSIYAPESGQVYDVFFRIGEKVAANQPVLAILTPANIQVLFYIPEPDLSRIHLGQTLSFQCDGCKGTTQATISYISPEAEYTPPIIYSQETRYNLVYLVRAAMPAEIAQQFHPGQPVDIQLHE